MGHNYPLWAQNPFSAPQLPPIKSESALGTPQDEIWKSPTYDPQYFDTPKFSPPKFFDLATFFAEAKVYVTAVADSKLAPADELLRQNTYHAQIPGTLTCLTENEWKFLPLWAGGLDDGTGHVFSNEPVEAIPDAAFSTPGPSIHTGDSTWSSAASSNGDFDMLSDVGFSDSFNTSTAVADGTSDQLFRHRIYTPSSGISCADDSSTVDLVQDMEEEKARHEVEALEAIQAAEEAHRIEMRRQHAEKAQDLCYDDMFMTDTESDIEAEDGSDSDATERGDDFVDLGEDDVFDLAIRLK